LFFFFPVVRWVNRRIDAAREMACDAWAIACGPLPAPDYARMLVRLVREHAAPAGALAFAATPGLLRGRVESAMTSRAAGPGLGDFVPEGSLDPEHLCCNCTEHGSTPPVAHEPVNTCVRGVTP